MSLRSRAARLLAGAGVAALATAGLTVQPVALAHADDPPTDPCSLAPAARPVGVYTWTGLGANDNWSTAANWSSAPGTTPAYPNDDTDHNGSPDTTTPTRVVCVDSDEVGQVYLDGEDSHTSYVWLKELSVLGNFAIHLHPNNTSLMVDGTDVESTLGANVYLDMQGQFGGKARIVSYGFIDVHSYLGPGTCAETPFCSYPAQFTSRTIDAHEATYTGTAGTLVIKSLGTLTLERRGVGLSYDYNLEVAGDMNVAPAPTDTASTPYLAASDGTHVTLDPVGMLTFQGNGGLLRGRDFGGPRATLSNSGTIVKTGEGTTSLVDIDYQPQPDGVVVVLSGDLRLPDGTSSGAPASAPRSADVASSFTFGTGTCGTTVDPQSGAPACAVTVDPAKDELGVAMTAPSMQDLTGATVDENAPATDVQYEHGPVVRADVDDFETGEVSEAPDRMDPAQITLRYATSTFDPGTSLGDLVLVRSPLSGPGMTARTELHDCSQSGVVDEGVTGCVDRSASIIATAAAPGNLVLVVDSIEIPDSRYIISIAGTEIAVSGHVTGQAKVGETLSALYTFDPDFATAEYKWLANNVEIPGTSNLSSITLQPAQVGESLTLQVTVEKEDWGTATLEPVSLGVVQPGVLTTGSAATATQPQVGAVTMAQAPTDWPPGTTFAYAWHVAAVRTVNGSTYTPIPEDQGLSVTLVTTGTVAGYEPAQRSSNLGTVRRGSLTGTAAAANRPRVGETSTVIPPTGWLASTHFTYRWDVAGGRSVTGPAFSPLPGEADRIVTLVTMATATGYEDAQVPRTLEPVLPGTLPSAQPVLTGKAKVHKALGVRTDGWAAGTTFSYQWFANGKKIHGATGTKLRLKDKLRRKKVYVEVTGTCPGYNPATATSRKVRVK